jgi:hypothetical protein
MRKSFVFSASCFVLGILLLIESTKVQALWREPMGPAVFPYVLSGLLIISAAISAIYEYKKIKNDNKKIKDSIDGTNDTESPPTENRASQKSVLFVAVSALAYVFGLTYLGFYVSTVLYVIVTVAGLSYFQDKDNHLRKTLTIGLPMAAIVLVLLVLAHKYMHLYFPSTGILW